MKGNIERPDQLDLDFKDAVHDTADTRYVHRLHCVKLVDAGCRAGDVARWYDRPVRTIERWVRQYAAEGATALKDKPRMGRPARLSEDVMAELAELVQHSPRSAGYPRREWTGGLLHDVVQSKYEVELSLRQTQRLLKRLQNNGSNAAE